MTKDKFAYALLALISLIGIVGVFLLEPIAQDPQYHLFKDQRTVFSIPNFWNIASNLPFLLVGLMGLQTIHRLQKNPFIADMKVAYWLFFLGVVLVALGSSYYHLSPTNDTLVWDRLPMTVAFMALVSIIIAEFTCAHLAKVVLWPLVIIGAFSVLYWQSTESSGNGDLRLYILVQFLPMILIPMILLIFKSKFVVTSGYWLLLAAYIVAKFCEHFDGEIYNVISILSGHSLKHIAAAVGVFFLLSSIKQRAVLDK